MEFFKKILDWRRRSSSNAPQATASQQTGSQLTASTSSAGDPQDFPSIEGYEILAKHAQGSGSIVYLANRAASGPCPASTTQYAIKVAKDPVSSQKLLAEAMLARQLSSQHFVQVLEQGISAGNLSYQVMEFIDGYDLERLVQRHGAVSNGRALPILIAICEAIAELHGCGVLHGDIKPSNIMLYQQGTNETIKLIDFGLARMLTGDNQQLADNIASRKTTASRTQSLASGTPHYSAPEVWSQSEVGFPVDVYSLGCCAYFLLSGKTPFSGNNPLEICSKHLRATPVHLTEFGIAKPLAELIHQAMSKNPEQRPSSVAAFSQALQQLRPA